MKALREYLSTIAGKFVKLWPYYLLQTLIAVIAIFISILAYGPKHVVIIASMGATAFICFAMPNCPSAKRKNVFFGHLIGVLCGELFSVITYTYYAEFPLVVGLTMFLMAALDVEHPPAAGTALAVTIGDVSTSGIIAILLSAAIMAEIRFLFKDHIRDLV